MQKIKIKWNFLQYLNSLSDIPDQREKRLKKDEHQQVVANTQLAIDKLTCKTVYNNLISRQQCPPTAEKRLAELGFNAQK